MFRFPFISRRLSLLRSATAHHSIRSYSRSPRVLLHKSTENSEVRPAPEPPLLTVHSPNKSSLEESNAAESTENGEAFSDVEGWKATGDGEGRDKSTLHHRVAQQSAVTEGREMHMAAMNKTEQKTLHPARDREVPPEDWLEMPDILRIAKINKIKDGVPGAIRRHYAAPYAYSYRGILYREFLPWRGLKDENGDPILNEKDIKRVTLNLTPRQREIHEKYPDGMSARRGIATEIAKKYKDDRENKKPRKSGQRRGPDFTKEEDEILLDFVARARMEGLHPSRESTWRQLGVAHPRRTSGSWKKRYETFHYDSWKSWITDNKVKTLRGPEFSKEEERSLLDFVARAREEGLNPKPSSTWQPLVTAYPSRNVKSWKYYLRYHYLETWKAWKADFASQSSPLFSGKVADEEESRVDRTRKTDVAPEEVKSITAKKNPGEWEPKSGLLFEPRRTGFPEADRVSEYIRNGYTTKLKGVAAGDTTRIHVVRRELCDDVLERLKPSLQKHVGCDIIDLNPGPGVWSSALHEVLKPRTHILMEPDTKLYLPLLQPLLDAKDSTYKLIPKNGTVWTHLESVFTPDHLPHQQIFEKGDPRLEEQNNTLLFVANLGFYPKKVYRGFNSLCHLVIHQLLSAVRAHSLFQKYGLVRMLIWMPDDDKHPILPKNLTYRRKAAIEAEISCSDIFEIASSTHKAANGNRTHSLELESSIATLKRMKAAQIENPQGRQLPLELEALESLRTGQLDAELSVNRSWVSELTALEEQYAAGEFRRFYADPTSSRKDISPNRRFRTTDFYTPEWKELLSLERRVHKYKMDKGKVPPLLAQKRDKLHSAYVAGEFTKYKIPGIQVEEGRKYGDKAMYTTPEYLRMQLLRGRFVTQQKWVSNNQPLLEEFKEIVEMQKRATEVRGAEDAASIASLRVEIAERIQKLKDDISFLNEENAQQFHLLRDNQRAFNQDPPILYWDRRQAEPLKVEAEEFFPRFEMALLDFQPRSIWPVLRENFPGNYDVFDYILSYLLANATASLKEGILGLYPGALEWLEAECPSLTDPNKGGNFDLSLVPVRGLTQDMYKEIMEAWMRWPFKPTMDQLLRRMGSPRAEETADEFLHEDDLEPDEGF